MTVRSFVLTLLCVGFVSNSSFATSTVSQGGGGNITSSVEQNLQDILDDLVVSGPPIDASTPSPMELFTPGPTGITAQVITGVKDTMFGIYPGGNPDGRALLLGSWDPTSEVRAISFSTDGTISWPCNPGASPSGFDGPFGFFAKGMGSQPYVLVYTEDMLNGGAQRALAFQGNGQTVIQIPGLRAGTFRTDQFILAFDVDGDGNFGDMVAMVAGIESGFVPEPSAALLMGLSLLALVRARRS